MARSEIFSAGSPRARARQNTRTKKKRQETCLIVQPVRTNHDRVPVVLHHDVAVCSGQQFCALYGFPPHQRSLVSPFGYRQCTALALVSHAGVVEMAPAEHPSQYISDWTCHPLSFPAILYTTASKT